MSDNVIWITGATSGIGEELAYAYAQQGAHLILSARRKDKLNVVKNNCKYPNKITCLPLDLSDSTNFNALVNQVITKHGKLDILINNGGISQRSLALETTETVDRKIMEVNYFGNIALTKAVLPLMIQQKKGQIVVISSLAGKFGFFLRSAYAASKHALHGFYEALRLEQEHNNIDISIICPGLIKTEISLNALDKNGEKTNLMDKNQETGMPPKECAKKIIAAIKNRKHETLIGKGEEKSVLIKRLFPKLFYYIIKKQQPK